MLNVAEEVNVGASDLEGRPIAAIGETAISHNNARRGAEDGFILYLNDDLCPALSAFRADPPRPSDHARYCQCVDRTVGPGFEQPDFDGVSCRVGG